VVIRVSVQAPQHGATILWCLRHYSWVLIACVLAGAGAPLLLAPATANYEADALVVARQLGTRPEALPQLGDTVFRDGAVAAAVAADPAIGGSPSGMIPDRLDVVAAKDSVVLVVQAFDTEPVVAAHMANVAAAAFVDELNKPGAKVGQFAIQTEATVPFEPETLLPPRTRAALGGVAGLALGLGLVALLGVIRRPVVTARHVTDVTGVPLLGTVQLPRTRHGRYAGPLGIRGIANVTRWLANIPPGRLLLISTRSADALRHRLFVMVGVALWSVRTMRFDGPQNLVEAIREHCAQLRDAGRRVERRPDRSDELVLVDGGSPFELVDPANSSVSVAAVAPLGTPRRRLRALAAEYTDGGLFGVVLIDVRLAAQRTASRRARRARAAEAAGPTKAPARPVREPERA
jgi:hypothetical protein